MILVYPTFWRLNSIHASAIILCLLLAMILVEFILDCSLEKLKHFMLTARYILFHMKNILKLENIVGKVAL